MKTLKVKIYKDEGFNRNVHPHVVEILGGRLAAGPNESVLGGACEDILETLRDVCHVPFRYEQTSDGHFFYIEESDFERARPAFTVMFLTKAEISEADGIESENVAIQSSVLERDIEVVNQYGIHARPSAMLVQLANQFQAELFVSCIGSGTETNAKSIMGVMGLAAVHGTVLRFRAIGDDGALLLDAVERLLLSKFAEEA